MPEMGDRIVLVRDVTSDEGQAFARGETLWIVAFRGDEAVVCVNDTGDYVEVAVEHVAVVPPMARRAGRLSRHS